MLVTITMERLLLVLPLAIGLISGRVCPVDTTRAPSWTPPSAVFGIVWSVIYMAMGVIMMYMYENRSPPLAWVLLVLNLGFNFTWTYVHSCMSRPDLSLWWIVAMRITLMSWFVHSQINEHIPRTISLLVIPYLAWLDVAFSLNVQMISN